MPRATMQLYLIFTPDDENTSHRAGPAHKNSPKYHLNPEVIAEGCLEALALNAQARRFALEPIERQLADDIEVAR